MNAGGRREDDAGGVEAGAHQELADPCAGPLNAAIADLVEHLNDRTMRGWSTARRALFEQFDRPALLALPPLAYEYADWQRRCVGLDYHVEIERHFYSVPHHLLRQEVGRGSPPARSRFSITASE